MSRLGPVARYAAILAYVLFALFPLFWLLKISFTPGPLLYSEGIRLWPSATTLDNFRFVVLQSHFPWFFANSLTVSAATAALVTVLAGAAGYALSRFSFRAKPAIAFLLLLTQMFPLVMLIPPIYRLMTPLGLTDSLLGLTIVYLLLGLPIATWMLKGYMDDIPSELDEAATVDGASVGQVLRQVILPLMAPATVAVGAFAFLLSWGEYLFAIALLTSTDKRTLPLALQAAFGQYTIDWGLLTAGGVIISLPPAILFLFLQRYLVGGLTAGGVKG